MKPIEAWASIAENPQLRKSYTAARGLGGMVRTTWDEALEIIASANLYTIKSTDLTVFPASHRFRATPWFLTEQVPATSA